MSRPFFIVTIFGSLVAFFVGSANAELGDIYMIESVICTSGTYNSSIEPGGFLVQRDIDEYIRVLKATTNKDGNQSVMVFRASGMLEKLCLGGQNSWIVLTYSKIN